jgi:multiple sugar transport system substrate-binding protein
MQEGLAAMTTLWWQYNIDWNKPELSKIAGNARMAKLPQKPDKGLGYGHMGCWAVFIDKNCKEVDAAWEFIKFISSAEAQKYMVARGNGPTRLSSFQSEEFINAVGPEAAQIIADVYAVGKMPSPSPIFPEARETVARELHQAFTGAKTPKQAMDDAASAIQKLIQ